MQMGIALFSSHFGKLFARQITGQIYAQPLLVSDLVVIPNVGKRHSATSALDIPAPGTLRVFDATNISGELWNSELNP
jgi:hypothetical protein